MAKAPGGGLSEQDINNLAATLQRRWGQAKGIPGLGNVGSQSLDQYKQFILGAVRAAGNARRGMLSRDPNDLHAMWLQYLTRHGKYLGQNRAANRDLPMGAGGGQNGVNRLNPAGPRPDLRRTLALFDL